MKIDAVIFGGGIAGLWTLDALRRAGHTAVLLESGALGAGQSICAQGIIHGGTKYSLKGAVTGSARMIADMPGVWRAALAGEGEPDLRAARVLASSCWLWNTEAMSSRAGMLGAKVGLRVVPEALSRAERPPLLRDGAGEVLRLPEQVVDPVSVLAALAARHPEALVRYEAGGADPLDFAAGPEGVHVMAPLAGREGEEIALLARAVVFCAGAGNAWLRERAGLPGEAMQRRPLHMAMLRGAGLPEFHGHCVDGARTRVTITSARDAGGRRVWQLGGQLAEDGVALEPNALIERARRELAEVLPGLDAAGCEWATYRVDRAEGRTKFGLRPDGMVVKNEGRYFTAWPTKMVLAPALAEHLVAAVGRLTKREKGDDEPTAKWPAGLPRPEIARPPWEEADEWTT